MRLLKLTREHAQFIAPALHCPCASALFPPPLDGSATAAINGHHGLYRGGVPDFRYRPIPRNGYRLTALAAPDMCTRHAAVSRGDPQGGVYFHIRPDRRAVYRRSADRDCDQCRRRGKTALLDAARRHGHPYLCSTAMADATAFHPGNHCVLPGRATLCGGRALHARRLRLVRNVGGYWHSDSNPVPFRLLLVPA